MEPTIQFQFLIGTLKTKTRIASRRYSLAFQFLIGTLKTQALADLEGGISLVSIPDRYSKNPIPKGSTAASLSVSIPDRYSKNQLIGKLD